MTVDHSAAPGQDAVTRANRLAELLARRNIPADPHLLPRGIVVVSIYAGLVAHVTDSVIWWAASDVTGSTDRSKITWVYTVEAAAVRLENAYYALRSVPLAELLAAGRITPLAAALLGDTGNSQAAPI